jgi:hypothetical protein
MNMQSRALAALFASGLAVTAAAAGANEAAVPKSTTAKPVAIKPATPAPVPLTVSPPVMVQPTPGAAAMPAAPTGPVGKVEIKETIFDAGSVDRGADLSHAFEIKNIGKGDLTVDAKPG